MAAIQRWAEVYGDSPAAEDWNTGKHDPERRLRHRAGDYPALSTVQAKFGRWSSAVAAAGFKCRHKNAGRSRNRVPEADYREAVALRRGGMSFPAIGERYGITATTAQERVKRQLRREGVNVAPPLTAATVLEREIARFKERQERAEAEAKDAAEQVLALEAAQAALNGRSALTR